MTQFSFTVRDNGAVAVIDQALTTLQDLGMAEVGQYLEREHKQYFVQQAGPDGGWAGLAPSTLRTKRSGAILRETGALAAGITASNSRTEAKMQSAGPFYNKFHQAGTSKMPQRKIIGFRPYHADKIRSIIRRNLNL